jgi:hypothetical protein
MTPTAPTGGGASRRVALDLCCPPSIPRTGTPASRSPTVKAGSAGVSAEPETALITVAELTTVARDAG